MADFEKPPDRLPLVELGQLQFERGMGSQHRNPCLRRRSEEPLEPCFERTFGPRSLAVVHGVAVTFVFSEGSGKVGQDLGKLRPERRRQRADRFRDSGLALRVEPEFGAVDAARREVFSGANRRSRSASGRPLTSASAPPVAASARFRFATSPSGTTTASGRSAMSMSVPSTSRKRATWAASTPIRKGAWTPAISNTVRKSRLRSDRGRRYLRLGAAACSNCGRQALCEPGEDATIGSQCSGWRQTGVLKIQPRNVFRRRRASRKVDAQKGAESRGSRCRRTTKRPGRREQGAASGR